MIVTRPATAADVHAVHPDMRCSYRAWAVDRDDRLVGLIGLALTHPPSLFAWFDEELRPMLSCPALMRLVVRARQAMDRLGVPVATVRDPRERQAPRILKRLGFRFDHFDGVDAVYARVPGEIE